MCVLEGFQKHQHPASFQLLKTLRTLIRCQGIVLSFYNSEELDFHLHLCNWQHLGRSPNSGCNCHSRIFECSVVVYNSAPMNLGVTILIQEIFEHRESLTILTPQIWEPVVGFNFKTVKKLFTNKVSMYL